MNYLKRNNQKRQLVSVMIMTMLLLFPIVFSFSHALTHHHEARCRVHHNEKITLHSDYELQIESPAEDEHCPICEYEFPLAVENAQQTITESYFKFVDVAFPVQPNFIASEPCTKNSPRAPPTIS